ncbi:hypothetical protein Agabi119p4_3169 [Agaricus bisporus var. burnettii]|uniref:NmrA-like domain-containing protein n=1 Tax=Agaricus bisporus var. burnettii TaxID=192524 RepID=A0A8H7KJ14_AGABI|nr:hypothetical protein Agabi119p4_3169 [Agaricus bisporus var. burnettii]
MMSKLIVVIGATGQQGGSVIDFLLKEAGGVFKVRGVTRNPSSPASLALAARGVEVVKADLSSLEDTTKAFSGAWGIYAVTQFYEHGYEAEQLHGKNIVEAAKVVGANHIVLSTVEGREGQCLAISWTSKALIEDRVIESGIPFTFVHIPMYYENFWTDFFAPQYNEELGFHWSVNFLPDVPIFAYSVADHGAWVVPAFREPEKYTGKRIKIVADYISLRDVVIQFSQMTGEKASLAFELTKEQFEASRNANHPAAELMYLSWEYVIRAGPNSGVRDKEQTFSIYPQAKTYQQWLKDSEVVRGLVAKLKAEAAASSTA